MLTGYAHTCNLSTRNDSVRDTLVSETARVRDFH